MRLIPPCVAKLSSREEGTGNMDFIMQSVGVFGAALLLLAYFNNSTKRWTTHNMAYLVANLGGALLICVNTFYFTVYGPFILNFFWALIALNGIRSHFSTAKA